jgi:hypothetical protein
MHKIVLSGPLRRLSQEVTIVLDIQETFFRIKLYRLRIHRKDEYWNVLRECPEKSDRNQPYNIY